MIARAAALIAFGLSLVSCSRQQSRGVAIDQAFRPLISPDAVALVGIHFDKLQQSPLYVREQSRLKVAVPDLVRNVTDSVGMWDRKQWVLLARSSAADIGRELTQAGDRFTTDGKYRIWHPTGEGAVAVVNNHLAVGGTEEGIKAELAMFDRHSGSLPDELKGELEELPASSQVWAVSRGGLPNFGAQSGSDIASMLANVANDVSKTGLGVTADTGLHLRCRIVCTAEQTGKRVHDALRAAIGFARLSTNERDLLPVYDAFQVDQSGSVVTVAADLSGDQVDLLLGMIDKTRSKGSISRLR